MLAFRIWFVHELGSSAIAVLGRGVPLMTECCSDNLVSSRILDFLHYSWVTVRSAHEKKVAAILNIIIHSFYIALFSALEQTHCAHWHLILNEWLYPVIASIINIHVSGVLVALCGYCMTGATWNAAVLAQVLCTPFNHAPGYSVTSFKAT